MSRILYSSAVHYMHLSVWATEVIWGHRKRLGQRPTLSLFPFQFCKATLGSCLFYPPRFASNPGGFEGFWHSIPQRFDANSATKPSLSTGWVQYQPYNIDRFISTISGVTLAVSSEGLLIQIWQYAKVNKLLVSVLHCPCLGWRCPNPTMKHWQGIICRTSSHMSLSSLLAGIKMYGITMFAHFPHTFGHITGAHTEVYTHTCKDTSTHTHIYIYTFIY